LLCETNCDLDVSCQERGVRNLIAHDGKMDVGYGGIYMRDVGDGFCELCVKIGQLLDSSQKLICDMTYS